ncbi:hypothetical protein [Sphingobacterium cellulitidis]|uniref:hypothetical protein n=1 Tax=Sphingobacterium cellulitidis TaxID=1768011 RepID=UPI0015C6284F|nr:hypothetical protein [Sphingobacterium cellulitidis]
MKASAECRNLGFLCYRGSVDQHGSFQWTKLYRLQKKLGGNILTIIIDPSPQTSFLNKKHSFGDFPFL